MLGFNVDAAVGKFFLFGVGFFVGFGVFSCTDFVGLADDFVGLADGIIFFIEVGFCDGDVLGEEK